MILSSNVPEESSDSEDSVFDEQENYLDPDILMSNHFSSSRCSATFNKAISFLRRECAKNMDEVKAPKHRNNKFVF